jgi:hypothetical protein
VSPGRISRTVRTQVETQAGNRCGYCLSPQRLILGRLQIDHIIPQAVGGTDDEQNLWLACPLCNGYKGMQINAIDPASSRRVRLFNPRRQRWSRHFVWSDDGARIVGRTAAGRATVVALQLNNVVAVTVRREWITVGWHPPPL